MTGNPTLVEVNIANPWIKTPEWVQAWQLSKAGRHAIVQFTTRGEPRKVPATRVRAIEEEA